MRVNNIELKSDCESCLAAGRALEREARIRKLAVKKIADFHHYIADVVQALSKYPEEQELYLRGKELIGEPRRNSEAMR